MARSSRAGGERGATLTIAVIATGITLLALGGVYLASAEKAYRLSAMREREAVLFTAADAGLTQAIAKLAAEGPSAFDVTVERDGARVRIRSTPGTPATVSVAARSGAGDLELARGLTARIDLSVAGRPRVLSVLRD